MESVETILSFTDNFLQRNVTPQPSSILYPGGIVTNRTYPGEVITSSGGCVELPAASLLPCDHAASLISKATRVVIEDVVYVGLLPLLAVVGVVVNVINMAVFVAQGLRDRVNICLFSLSLADLLVVTSLYVRYINRTLAYVISLSWAHRVWLMSLIRYRLLAIHAGFQMVSNFISIVIAVDRCMCVTWPLRAARVLSTRVTALVIIVFSLLVFAGIQFTAFKYDVTCVVMKGMKSRPIPFILPSKLYRDYPVLKEILDTIVFSSLVPTLSLLVTTSATAITAIKLKRAAVWREGTAGGGGSDVINQKEKSLTYMLIVTSCIYIACVCPRVVRAWYRIFIPEFRAWGKLCNLMLVTEALMHSLLAVNSTLNFFVYYFMGSRFRSTLRHLVTRFRSRSQKS